MWSLAFWQGATERALKTFFQTVAASIGVNAMGLGDVDWVHVLSLAGLACVFSLATSLGNAEVTARQAKPGQNVPVCNHVVGEGEAVPVGASDASPYVNPASAGGGDVPGEPVAVPARRAVAP